MSMKRVLSIAAIVVLLLSLCSCLGQDKSLKPTESFYVNDFADVISEKDEEKMLSAAVALNEKTTAQVVVVTIESLDGKEISDYALELGREWGVGNKESNNGIVILLSEGDRDIYIAVGYGLEGALPDSKTGRIIDVYGLEYLKQDEFSKGLSEISAAIINEIYLEYGLPTPAEYVPIDKIPNADSIIESGGEVAVYWVVLIIIFILIFFFTPKNRRTVFIGGPFIGGFRSNGTGFSGGGFKGGGFRGGGGSFGGGGAGRGF